MASSWVHPSVEENVCQTNQSIMFTVDSYNGASFNRECNVTFLQCDPGDDKDFSANSASTILTILQVSPSVQWIKPVSADSTYNIEYSAQVITAVAEVMGFTSNQLTATIYKGIGTSGTIVSHPPVKDIGNNQVSATLSIPANTTTAITDYTIEIKGSN